MAFQYKNIFSLQLQHSDTKMAHRLDKCIQLLRRACIPRCLNSDLEIVEIVVLLPTGVHVLRHDAPYVLDRIQVGGVSWLRHNLDIATGKPLLRFTRGVAWRVVLLKSLRLWVNHWLQMRSQRKDVLRGPHLARQKLQLRLGDARESRPHYDRTTA